MRAKSVINSVGILLLAIVAGAGITWLIYDRSQDDAALLSGVDGDASSAVVTRDQTQAAIDPPPVDGAGGVAAIPSTAGAGNDPVSSDRDAEPSGDPLWNTRIRTALTSTALSVRQKSRQLLDLAAGDHPSATVDQRLEALEHGLNLVDDADYAEDAMRLALRSDLPAELGESILTDLHGRDPELLIGTCEKIAALQDHPMREEAQEIVDFLGAEVN